MRVRTILIVLGAICVAAAGEAQNQDPPKRVPPRLGTDEPLIKAPIRAEYEAASAHLFGTTLSAAATVKACARLYPDFSKENAAALEAWEKQHAEALVLIRRSAREVLLKHSGGDAARVERDLQWYTMDAHDGTYDKMAREDPAVARKTCQAVPITLTRGPFVLESTPQFSVLRAHGEDSTN
jgi:hypothetical protein